MKTTILVNKCYGGFHLSDKAYQFFKDKGFSDEQAYNLQMGRCPRHLPILIEAFDTFGSGFCSRIEKQEIEAKLYTIKEYDGYEEVVTSNDFYSVYDLNL